ncbi:MAG: folate family ECF transporter S component [Lachnospiraceae bacterium]|nr:folate family ECF transporter S component [Lachnospiraceae bacterium]
MSKLRNIKVLTTVAMLIAISIIAGFFKIPLTIFSEIRFSSLPIAASGILFGPGIGGIVGALSDIGGYIVKPTGPFFPGFTISSALSGVIFGLLLYRGGSSRLQRIPFYLRVFIAELLHTIIIGLLLNSLWLSILYGNAFLLVAGGRVIKELIMLPINTILLCLVSKPVVGSYKRFFSENDKQQHPI